MVATATALQHVCVSCFIELSSPGFWNLPAIGGAAGGGSDLPGATATAPARNVQHDNALYGRQLNPLSIQLHLGSTTRTINRMQNNKQNNKK